MMWIWYILFAQFIWASFNVIQKIIITKKIKKEIVYLVITNTIYCSMTFLLLFFKRPSFDNIPVIMIAVLAGIFSFFGALMFFKTLHHEEISRIAPLFNLTPILILLLSFIFLKENLSFENYISFFLIILGGFLISIKIDGKKLRVSKVIFLMMLSCLFFAISNILIKYSSRYLDVYSYFFYSIMGWFISTIPFFFSKTVVKDIINKVKTLGKKTWILIIAIEVAALPVTYLVSTVIKTIDISLIAIVGNTQPVFVLLIATLLSHKFPHLIEEDKSRKALLIKASAILIMFIGLYLLK